MTNIVAAVLMAAVLTPGCGGEEARAPAVQSIESSGFDSRLSIAGRLIKEGHRLGAARDLAGARARYQAALETSSCGEESGSAIRGLAVTAYNQGDSEEALSRFEQYLPLAPPAEAAKVKELVAYLQMKRGDPLPGSHEPPPTLLEHRPPSGPHAQGQPLALEVLATTAAPLSRGRVWIRKPGESRFTVHVPLQNTGGARWSAVVPAELAHGEIEYAFGAYGQGGVSYLGADGSAPSKAFTLGFEPPGQ